MDLLCTVNNSDSLYKYLPESSLSRNLLSALVVPCSSSASPESGLGTSHTSLPGSNGANDQAITTEEMYYEAEPLQPLGTCKALYTFDGK